MKCHAGVEFPDGKPCPKCNARLGEVCWPGINADLLAVKPLREENEKLKAQLAHSSEQLSDADLACQKLCGNHGFATGHGDTIADMIGEIDGQIAERHNRSSELSDVAQAYKAQIDGMHGWCADVEKRALAAEAKLAEIEKAEATDTRRLMWIQIERERCAKIADEFSAYEQTVVDRAKADEALSDNGRKTIIGSACSRQIAAEQIAHDIRAVVSEAGQS